MSTYSADIIIRETGADEAARKIKNVGDNADRAHPAVGRLEQGLEMLKHVLLAVGLAMSVEKIIEMADQYAVLQKRLAQVTSSGEQQAAVWNRLSAVANEHSQSMDGVVNMYVAMTRALASYRISSEQIIGTINSISAILQANGRSADDVSGAMRRLAAGMAQGVISGRAMTTLFVQFPELIDGIAKASGRSTQAIKIMAENGSISMQQLMKWMEQAASKMDQTRHSGDEIGDAMTRLKNVMLEAVGVMDRGADGSSRFAGSLDYIGKMLKALAIIVVITVDSYKQFFGLLQQVGDIILKLLQRIPILGGVIRTVGDAAGYASGKFSQFIQSSAQNIATSKQGENAAHANANAHQQLGHTVEGTTQQIIRNTSASQQQAGSLIRVASTTHQTAQVTDQLGNANQRVASTFGQLGEGAASTTTQLAGAGGAAGQVTVNMGALGSKVVEVGGALGGLNGQITVTRGGMDGLTKTVYENGKALQDGVVNLSRTTSTMDALGNTSKTTTESIKDMDGKIIGLKKTIDSFNNGVHTTRQYVMEADGSMKLLSETVVEQTKLVQANAGAWSGEQAALRDIVAKAAAAAEAYKNLGSAAAGATSAASGFGIGAGKALGDTVSDMSGHKGTFSAPTGFHFLPEAVKMGFHGKGQQVFEADPSTVQAFAEFNAKVRDTRLQLLQATGIDESHWPSGKFNPWTRIPREQTPDSTSTNGGAPFGTIPSVSELLDMMKTYGSTPVTSSSITTPRNPLPGMMSFGNSGSFDVGGSGGTDSQYVHFMATPGEHVEVGRDGSGGNTVIAPKVFMTVNARDAGSFGRNRTQIMGMLNEGVQRAASQLQRRV